MHTLRRPCSTLRETNRLLKEGGYLEGDPGKQTAAAEESEGERMKGKQLFRGGNVSTHAKFLSIFFVHLHKPILPRRRAVERSQRAALRLAVTQP